jgi:phosphoribosylformylglycinamidine cyclo-ligase
VPRILPEAVAAKIDATSWTMPPLFTWLAREGQVAQDEMYRTFNCGIGMVVIVAAEHAEAAMQHLTSAGEQVYRLGTIAPRNGGEAVIIG